MFHLTIDREWDARPLRDGARYRATLRDDRERPLMKHTLLCASVEDAIGSVERIFGALEWRQEPDGPCADIDWTQRIQILVPSNT